MLREAPPAMVPGFAGGEVHTYVAIIVEWRKIIETNVYF